MDFLRERCGNCRMKIKFIWIRSTIWEKWLTITVICLLLAIICCIVVIQMKGKYKELQSRSICTSDICVIEAARIIEQIDKTSDPCNDFYEFACGSYLKKYAAPPDIQIKSASTDAEEDLWKILKGFLEMPLECNEIEAVSKVKKFYKTCMNQKVDLVNIKEEINVLTEVIGLSDWPFVEANYSRKKSLEEVLALTVIYENELPFFKLYGTQDAQGMVIGILLGHTILMEEILLNTAAVHKRNKYMRFLLRTFLTLDISLETATALTEDILNFEISLANITSMQRSDYSVHMNISDLSHHCPSIKWDDLLSYIYNNLKLPANFTQPKIAKVISLEYLIDICEFIKSKNDSLLDNFIVWSYIFNYLPYLNEGFRQDYNSLKTDTTRVQYFYFDQWRECLNLATTYFQYPLTYLYLQKVSLNKTVKQISEIFENLKISFDEMFEKEQWPNERTKILKKKQLKKLNWKLAYIEDEMNSIKINQLMSEVNISNSWIRNLLSIDREELRHHFFDSLKRKSKDSIYITFGTGAVFTTFSYSIVLQLGLLSPPFFVQDIPKYLNYGGVGGIIAHEITHAFQHFDIHSYEGIIPNNKQEDDTMQFAERIKCFEQQYSKYFSEVEFSKFNGQDMVDENIADFSGFQQSFDAYKKSQELDDDLMLPGLNYSSDELFIIRYAQSICEIKSERLYKLHLYYKQSPGKFRVNGVLQNSPQFSEVFKCKEGSKMNPSKKCNIWGQ